MRTTDVVRIRSRKANAWAIAFAVILASCSSDPSAPADRSPGAAGDTAASSVAAKSVQPEVTKIADLFPPGDGKDLVLKSCSGCHSVACATIGQRPAARWTSLKTSHRDKVPNLSGKDLDVLFAYLSENFNDAKPEPKVPAHFLEGGCTPF